MKVFSFVKKYSFIIGAFFILYLFRYISIRTPLAGDDWGYCLKGNNVNIIENVLSFYLSWSGRLFCELWGFTMATYKNVWNFVNPVLFLLIYLSIYFLGETKRNKILSFLLIIVMILTVYFQIRTQTYTWVAGGNYSVSLCLSLLYFLIIDNILKHDFSKNILISLFILSDIVLLIIGLMIENIALTMIFSNVILLIYLSKKGKKSLIKFMLINIFVSIVSFCITRLSPGSAFRLARDHAEWLNLTFTEKISSGYIYFLEYAFINNNYTVSFFSLVVILLVWSSSNNKKAIIKIVNSLILFISIFSLFSSKLLGTNLLNNPSSIFSFIFWPIYIINAFFVLYSYLPQRIERDKTIFFLLVGGLSASAMIMSPVNGARAYIYLVYYVILVSVIVLNMCDLNKLVSLALMLFALFIIVNKTNYYKNLYNEIEYAQEKRLVKINYYQEHPEDEDVWIERFPENALHSIDIEKGDTYHFEVFKEYYNLPQDANNIFFYFDK